MTPDEAFERICALRRITAELGMSTKRSQNALLMSLPDDVLAEVAARLMRFENGNSNGATRNDDARQSRK